MPMPQVSWEIATLATPSDITSAIASTAAAASWPIGTVDADAQPKALTTFLVWNNKGTSAAPTVGVSDMQDCSITVVDANHGNTGAGNCLEILRDQWVRVQCLSASETAMTPVGSLAPATINAGAHPIKATGVTGNVIEGAGNVGDFATNTTNYARVAAELVIPNTASAGAVNGYIRIAFKYV